VGFKFSLRKKFSEYRVSFSTTKKLLSLLWQTDKLLFLGNLATASIPAIIPFVNAYIYKLIIDLVVRATTSSSAFNFQTLYVLLGLRIVSLVIQEAGISLQNYFELLLWTKFPIHIYQMILTKLANLDLQYFEDSTFKDKLEKVRDAYQWRTVNMVYYFFYGYQSFLQFLIALIAIATLNWFLIVLSLLAAIPIFINQTNYAKITWGLWQQNSPYRKKFWYLADLIQGGQSVKEIKIFQTASKFLSELKEIYQRFVKENSKVARTQFGINLSLNLFGVVIYIGIEIFIFLSAIARKITIGDITYFTTVLNNFQNGITGLFRNISQIYDQGLYVQEMFSVLDVEPKIKQVEKPKILNIKKAPKIEFKNVTFSYPGTKRNILNNFSLTIEPGEKIALVGENGAGKTTIIKLLARFYDVDHGEILIDGINLKELDLSNWYKTMGVLFQDFIKYEYSLKDNIYFGKVYEPQEIKQIINAARLSGADKVADDLPEGYNQMLGKTFENGVELSAGQWQKVALARAYLRDAPILIMDEPTASIDAKAESEIFEKVEKLSRNKTVIIISHRFSTVRNADKIYVIEKGKIIESGSHEQLLKAKKTYATLFNLQAKGYK